MSAFCEPVTTTSAPHASVSSGTAPRLETASTIESAPASRADLKQRLEVADDSRRRLRVDEEDGLRPALGERASAGRPGRGDSPQAYVSGTTSQPNAAASFCQRSPNSPCETASTRSPGERRFTIADSKAPVPEDVKTSTSLSVRKTFRKPLLRDPEDLGEVGRAVVEDGLGERAQDLRRARRSAPA